MGVVVRRTNIMDIYIETNRKVITVRQRWKYNWLLSNGALPWTYEQRKAFHDKADSVVWNMWSGNFIAISRTEVNGNGKFDNKRFVINFDIEWVLSDPHWNVNVTKVVPGVDPRSNVNWNTNVINLSDTDPEFSSVDCGIPFNILAHEFGHTIFNGDEYGTAYSGRANRYDEDYTSMLNIGTELRDRFVNTIDDQLDKAIPGVRFVALLSSAYMNSIGAK